MSKTVSNNPKSFAVTMAEFVRFLQAKTDDAVCAACGSQWWTVVGSTETGATYRLSTPLRDGPKATQLSTFAIYCNECGLVRHHLSRVVRKWVDANPAPEEAEQEELDLDEDDSEQ